MVHELIIFLSYARVDASLVRALVGDLRRLGHQVWFDDALQGGESWWSKILEEIRHCEIFVFGLSSSSLKSPACLAELSYSQAVNRPLLPVKLGAFSIEAEAPDVVRATQMVDYVEGSAESVFGLIASLDGISADVPLPDPLPPQPAFPTSPIRQLKKQIEADNLDESTQLQVFRDLREFLERDDSRDSALSLLRALRERPDVSRIRYMVTDLLEEFDGTFADEDLVEGDEARSKEPLWEAYMRHIYDGHCAPVLGWGVSPWLQQARRLISRAWSEEYRYPLGRSGEAELSKVAQFVAAEYSRREMQDAFVGALPGAIETVRQSHVGHETDPHAELANMPMALYITVNPMDTLTQALVEEGRDAVVECCRWRPEAESHESIWDVEPDFRPTPARPLVFHLFGALSQRRGLVLTEDDYLAWLSAVQRDRDIIPVGVRRAFAESSMVLLGFDADDWDLRLLLHGFFFDEPPIRRRVRRQGLVQVDVRPGVQSRRGTRRYLETYLADFDFQMYWGSAESLVHTLWEAWQRPSAGQARVDPA